MPGMLKRMMIDTQTMRPSRQFHGSRRYAVATLSYFGGVFEKSSPCTITLTIASARKLKVKT